MSLVNGLPAHVLLVHVVVVLVPLTALALVAGALWPRAARHLGILLPALALVALASVPLTTQAGEWLERHVQSDALVRRHTELGDGLLPWALGLFVLAAVVWWAARRGAVETGQQGGLRWSALPVRIIVAALSVAVAAGAVVDVYRIGDSGAKAAWHDSFSKTESGSGGS
jgi:cytochrome bd-type quinol oxidase subunit 2